MPAGADNIGLGGAKFGSGIQGGLWEGDNIGLESHRADLFLHLTQK